jgi:integrase
VFSHSANGSAPWHPDNVSTKWGQVRTRLGLDTVRLHDLRHLQATMLLKAGVPVKNVSKRLGHRDAATTLNVYAQFLEETDRESAAVMGQVLARPDTNKSSRSP